MENASQALGAREYLACEALCLEALNLARSEKDWGYYARILLPLQEARRHRRTICAEGFIRLGITADDLTTLEKALPDQPFCLVLTSPATAELAQRLETICRREFRFAEILWVENSADQSPWVLRSFHGAPVRVAQPAPPKTWQNRWLSPLEQLPTESQNPVSTPGSPGSPGSPGDWVINATEALGDAALKQVQSPLGSVARVHELEACLQAITDHEILHQRLSDAALALMK